MSSDRPSHSDPQPDVSLGIPTARNVVERLNSLWGNGSERSNARLPNFIPDRIGRYKVQRLLGRGSFGIVCLAHDEQLERNVALKMPRPEVLIDTDRLGRFEAEAKIAARLDHPGIVSLYEADLAGPTPYIASAFCPGLDLARWLEHHSGKLDWEDAALLIAELADAVQYAHEMGVLHRDLKPSNVMLVHDSNDDTPSASLADYRPRLTDFGLAKIAQSSLEDTRSSMLIGTPLYMAPELFAGPAHAEATPATDVYSLGCVLYELLTRRLPVEGDSYIEVVDRLRESSPVRLRKHRPDAPRTLEAICTKCLEKDPQARYDSAAALSCDLNRCLQGEPVAVERASPLNRFRYWARQPKRIRDAGLFAIVFHAVSILWLILCNLIVIHFDVLESGEYLPNVLQTLQLSLMFDLPLILIGWQTLRSKRWAILAGCPMSFAQLAMLGLVLSGVIEPLQDVYRNAEYHQAANYALIFVCCLIQLFLYLFALQASRKSTR